jgi:hypothetical protein
MLMIFAPITISRIGSIHTAFTEIGRKRLNPSRHAKHATNTSSARRVAHDWHPGFRSRERLY